MSTEKTRYKRLRNIFIWLTVALYVLDTILYLIVSNNYSDTVYLIYVFTSVMGIVFAITGCYYWAKYKGRTTWLAVLGIFFPIGIIPLPLLKDKRA